MKYYGPSLLGARVIMSLVSAVRGLSLIGGVTPCGNAAEATSKRTITQASPVWHQTLCRALMLYHEEKYSETFSLIEKAIREQSPGPEVHRCIALLQKSFAKMHKVDDPVMKWTTSAQEYMHALKGKTDKQESDLLILAALKSSIHGSDRVLEIPEELILLANPKPRNKGVWSDWARWALTRQWCDSFFVTEEACGVVIIDVGGKRVRAVLAESPVPTVKGRCAMAILRDTPNTYMGRQLRFELLNWRVAQAERGLCELGANEWMTDTRQRHEIVPFDKGIQQRLMQIKKSGK